MTSPSSRFSPVISASLPTGWDGKESITLLHESGQANVIASSEPLSDPVDSKRYADMQGYLLETEFPGFVPIAFEPMSVFGGRAGFRRKFEWTPPDGAQVTQLQIYYVENGRGYTATATSPSASFATHEEDLMEIIEGLKIT
jgi:hypothetical protein